MKLIPFPLSATGIEFEYDPVQDSDHWTNGDVKVTVNITNTGMYEDLKNYKIMYRLEQDTEWKDYDKNNKIDVTKNQYVYAKLESDGGRTLVATGEVKYIDKIAPVVVAEKEGDTITVKLTDEQSGVCGYAITTTNAKPSLSEFTSFAATSKWSKTLTGYYGTKYYVWAIDKAGNIGSNQQITTQELHAAIGNYEGSATVRGGTITGTGFGIYSRGATNLTITGGTIKANATTGSIYSDGIYIEQDSGYTANILSSTITGNNYGITVGGSNQASVRLGLRDTENYGGLYIEGTGKIGIFYSGSGSLEIDGKDVEEDSGTRIYRRSIWNYL